ncbi:hypothetical protein Hanom_Chr08g00717081 [Helianthus anomalus]
MLHFKYKLQQNLTTSPQVKESYEALIYPNQIFMFSSIFSYLLPSFSYMYQSINLPKISRTNNLELPATRLLSLTIWLHSSCLGVGHKLFNSVNGSLTSYLQ